MITFVHTADIHFGMENYGHIDPTTGIHTRLHDFAQSLHVCIDSAIERSVDFFLFCGDAYKTHHPTQTQQRMLFECLLRLYKAQIPVVIVIGNHDNPLSFGKAHALHLFGQLPLDGFYVIDKPSILNLQTKNGMVQIVGIPWPTRNTIALDKKHAAKSAIEITTYIAQGVAAIIKNFALSLDQTLPAVLAAHLTVSSGIFSGSEKRAIYGTDPILLPSQLAITPYDYVALGHLHRFQNVNGSGYPAVIYSGSIDRIDFGERKEEKGFCIVTLEKKGSTSYEFVTIPTRPFVQIEVKLQPDASQTEQVINAIKKHTIVTAIIKIIYYVPAGKKDTVDLGVIERACSSAHYLVGIFPILPVETRQQRMIGAKVDMDMAQLMTHYFDLRPAYQAKKDDLVDKALALLQEEAVEE